MFVDAHAHLDEDRESSFVQSLVTSDLELLVISNSVDDQSSIRNIGLSRSTKKIVPFVGIHPEIFSRNRESGTDVNIDSMIETVHTLARESCGIGEIGLDPKYGNEEEQEILFGRMLGVAEKTALPVSIHSRDTFSRILDILSTYNLKKAILFHWFAGSDTELSKIEDRAFFISFGPSLLFSKRIMKIFEKCSLDFVLSETDSPTPFASVNNGKSTPLLIPSVVFKMSLIKNIEFGSLKDTLESNVNRYLERKTH